MAMWNGHDEEDTETHGAIHTREAYEKLSIVYEKVREGCHYDLSCVRRYHFDLDFHHEFNANCTINTDAKPPETNQRKQSPLQLPRLTVAHMPTDSQPNQEMSTS